MPIAGASVTIHHPRGVQKWSVPICAGKKTKKVLVVANIYLPVTPAHFITTVWKKVST
jgi:hypothetical protein